MMTTIYALFLYHRFALDELHTGALLAMVGLIGAFIQGGMIGRLVKQFGEARLATAGTVILSLSLFALPLASGLGTLILYSAGVAVGNSLLMPTLMGMASRSVDQNWQGRALGLLQSAGSLGRAGSGRRSRACCSRSMSDARAKSMPARRSGRGAGMVAVSILFTLMLPRQMTHVAPPVDEASPA